MNKRLYTTCAALGLALAISAEHVQFSDTPKAVQNTVNKNLNGGVVKSIDKKVKEGRTIYDVAVRREGKDKRMRVDADGKMLLNDAGVSVDINTDKNDGKILGVVPAPKRNDNDLDAEARVGDSNIKVEGDLDTKDRGVTEDVFDKNDGKLGDILPAPSRDRDLNAETRVEIDRDDAQVKVETDTGKKRKIFHKGDGKLLGFIPWKKQEKKIEVEVETEGENTSLGAPAGSSQGRDIND